MYVVVTRSCALETRLQTLLPRSGCETKLESLSEDVAFLPWS